MKAILDIHKRSDGFVYLTVQDGSSHVQILEVKVSTEELMQALMGLSARPSEITRLITEYNFKKIGKELETKEVFIEKYDGYDKDKQKIHVVQKISELPEYDSWEIFSDGTTTQQPTDLHRVVMRRWL